MADQAYFLELFLSNEADLSAFLRSLVRDTHDFEDTFQAVALTLWRKFDQYDQSRPFGAWARGVAAREVLLLRRDLKRQPIPFSPESVAAILDAFEHRLASNTARGERIELLEVCYRALPESSQQVLWLRYTQSLAIAEIAERLGRTAAATQRSLSRIREQIAECIQRRLDAQKGEPR